MITTRRKGSILTVWVKRDPLQYIRLNYADACNLKGELEKYIEEIKEETRKIAK